MIERIIIENFKSIRLLELDLKPLNILIGANGAGKSNFISFFKLTNQIYEKRLQEYIGNNFNSFLHFGKKRSDFIYGLVNFENKYVFNYRLKPQIDSNKAYVNEAFFGKKPEHNEKPTHKDWMLLFAQSGGTDELTVNEEMPEGGEYPFVKPVNEYLKTFKIYHFHDTSQTSEMKQMSKVNDNRYLRENGENIAAFLYYLQEKHLKEFKIIEQNIRFVAPFFDRFDLEPDRLNEDLIELRWLEKGSDAYFNAYSLSDGTLRFIALTTLLLQPDLPKTIIIDEPELGLHPFAINKLAAMMKAAAAKDSQVIVSTQAVNLVDNFEPEDVIAVDRADDQSVFHRLNATEFKEWLEDYTLGELWNKNLIGARP